MNKKNKGAPEGEVNRYVFTCIGLIMYLMPCISCLGIGIAAEGVTSAYIFAIVVEALSVPLGLLGINAMKRPHLRKWCILAAAVLMVLHAVCAVMLLAWYVIMAPTFVLLALFIPWSAVVNKMGK
ncbi:MAG: hypothetical protein E7638_02510 [Ruminococcaceae bacterium]|nr:hypothetical protein [Oscillospiraceae bacterium]